MYKFQQPEDQIKFCLPLNRDTESLYYNTYLVIDANVLTEPRVFQISKINRSNSKGIAVFTCTQELANQHTLKADYDEDGNVVAWWADWNDGQIAPVPAIPINDESTTILALASNRLKLVDLQKHSHLPIMMKKVIFLIIPPDIGRFGLIMSEYLMQFWNIQKWTTLINSSLNSWGMIRIQVKY